MGRRQTELVGTAAQNLAGTLQSAIAEADLALKWAQDLATKQTPKWAEKTYIVKRLVFDGLFTPVSCSHLAQVYVVFNCL